jgi:ABC-2 type transport system ATP-binding protein
MNPIIEAENLSRFYGLILGLNNVSFRIRPGITGVTGPNGAGKTTLFRLLTGQIRPSSGVLKVFGEEPWNNPRVRSQLAYCPEGEAVPSGIRPVDWLVGLGMLSGLSAAGGTARARQCLEQVGLPAAHWRKPVTALSKGMRQRVKLAQCLLHQPRLIILDEPMNGLDPMGREDFSNVLKDLARAGTSILISSHLLHDLEALCTDFLFFQWGRIPRASNQAAAAESRRQWPQATTFRCASPRRLARYLIERDLLRGCEILEETRTLHVEWADAERFHAGFHDLLLDSGVSVFEVRSTASFLEKANDVAPRP